MPPDGNTGALNSEREPCPPAPRHRRLKDPFGGQRCTNAESALLDVGELNNSIDLGRQTAHVQIADCQIRRMVKIISGDVGAEGFHVGVYHRHRSRSGGSHHSSHPSAEDGNTGKSQFRTKPDGVRQDWPSVPKVDASSPHQRRPRQWLGVFSKLSGDKIFFRCCGRLGRAVSTH